MYWMDLFLVSFVSWHINLNGLFNAKATIQEKQQGYYLTNSWKDKGVHTFPKRICLIVNVIARLEFELAYYNPAAQSFNHYAMRIPPNRSLIQTLFGRDHCDIVANMEDFNIVISKFKLQSC